MKTTLRLRSVSVALTTKLFQKSNIAFVLYSMLLTPLLFLGEGLGVRCAAQNVGISATGAIPDNSAMLDVTSNTKGMLIPRMTGAEKYAISSPAIGLLIFQTDTVGFWYYDGSKWIPLVSSTSSTASPNNAGWLTTGNSGTAWNKNFLGTTDNVSLRMRTNNTEKMIVDSLGRVGISLTSPAYKLDILDSNSAGSSVQSRTLNMSQIRTEANITAATTAIGIKNTLLYRMTEGIPGTQGIGMTANNTVYTDGTYTYSGLYGANNQAYTTSTALANQNALYGSVNTGYLNSSGTLTNCFGAYNQSYNHGSGTIATAYGAQNYAFVNTPSTGTITNAYGSNNTVQNTSTVGGSITQAIGVNSNIIKAATASVIPTGYLYYGAYSSGAATKHYGLYITGEDTNYFSGKVGIGTPNPSSPLHVFNTSVASTTGQTVLRLTGVMTQTTVGSGPQILFSENTTGYPAAAMRGYTFGGSSTGLAFSTGWNSLVDRMVIDNTGNVGIGTTNPTEQLSVNTSSGGTSLRLTDGVNSTLLIKHTHATVSSPLVLEGNGSSQFVFRNNSTDRMTILNNGNVGIGCTAPQYKLHVIGDIASSATIRGVNAYVTGAITACSDIRFKKDITPLSHALDKVLSMQGVNYHWKTKEFPEKQFTEVQQIGFIAQELEKIIPEVVLTDKDGYKSVDYSRLTPVLVEAIKEQQKRIEKLEVRNQKSEEEITKLKAVVEKLMQAGNTAEVRK